MKKCFFLLVLLMTVCYTRLSAQVGDWIWARTGSAVHPVVAGHLDVTCDANNDIIVVGKTDDTVTFGNIMLAKQLPHPNGDYSLYMVKYNAAGNVLWAKLFENVKNGGDEPWQVVSDVERNIYVYTVLGDTLQFGNTVLPGGGTYLLKFDSNGMPQWGRKLEAWLPSQGAPVNKIAVDKNKNVYAIGSNSTSDPVLLKYNDSGQQVWTKTILSSNSLVIDNVVTDFANNIYVTGRFEDTLSISADTLVDTTNANLSGFWAKLDSSGNVLWLRTTFGVSKMFIDSTSIYSLGYTSATAPYYVDGQLLQPIGASSSQTFICKYDTAGIIQFAKTIAAEVYNSNFAVDAQKRIWFSGYNDVNTMALGTIVDTISGMHMFVACYDSAANLLFSKTMKYTNQFYTLAYGFAIDNNNNAYLSGHYADTCDLGNIMFHTSNAVLAPFLLKLTTYPLGVYNDKGGQIFSLYPNPNNGIFTIKLPPGEVYQSLRVVDQLGKIVYAQSITSEEETIQRSNISDGIYYLQLSGEKGAMSQRFVISR